MLDVQTISNLANRLHFVKGEINGWSAPDLKEVPQETLLLKMGENRTILRQCQQLLQQITRDDFVFEWAFYRKNETFFKGVEKILMAQRMLGLGDTRQGDSNGTILNALESLALTRHLKDVAFLDDFLKLERFIITPTLETFKTQRNNFSPALRKLIIEKCLAVLDKWLPDEELLNRSVGYLKRFQVEIVEDLKKAEKEELSKCGAEDAEEIKDYYSMCVKSASEPYTPEKLKKLEWGLKLIRAKLSLVLLDQGLQNYKEKEGDFPQKLDELIPDFIPYRVVDPFGQTDFLYERMDSSAYVLQSAGYFGLTELQKSGGHPLMLRVWNDCVVEGEAP